VRHPLPHTHSSSETLWLSGTLFLEEWVRVSDTFFSEESQTHSLRHSSFKIEALDLKGWDRVSDILFLTHTLPQRHSLSSLRDTLWGVSQSLFLKEWGTVDRKNPPPPGGFLEQSHGDSLTQRHSLRSLIETLLFSNTRPQRHSRGVCQKSPIWKSLSEESQWHSLCLSEMSLWDSSESQGHSDSQRRSSLKSEAGCETHSSSHTLFLRDTLTLGDTLL